METEGIQPVYRGAQRARLKTGLLLRQQVEDLLDQWAREAATPALKLR